MMEEKGLSRFRVTHLLGKKLKKDMSFSGGQIVGSMCTLPHKFAQMLYAEHLEKNVGDPGVFPGSVEIEEEAIRLLGSLLCLPDAHGAIVTGGTEANILAMWTAKELARGRGNEVLVPEHAHFSFDKAARMLGLDIVKIPLTKEHVVDTQKLAQRITKNTIALVGVAGSTALGTVDDMTRLSQLAVEHSLYLHVDAAFGGFVIPFLKDSGRPAPEFDFSLPGVSSITIDPHKMGMSAIPAGGILYRTRELALTVSVPVTYLAGGETALPTIVGTRSGAAAIAVWALARHLGRHGYRKIVAHVMDLTDWFAEQVRLIPGMKLAAEPVVNVCGIAHERIPAPELAKLLRSRGWAVSLFSTHLRIVIMPHVKKRHLAKFLKEIASVVAE